MEERDVVKEVLSNLRGYLGDHLPVDVDFLSKLQGKHLLAKENADKLRTAVKTEGGKSGVDGLLDYMYSYYDEEMLEEFCVFLEEYSQPARRGLSKITKRIRKDLKQYQPQPTQPAETQQDVPGPSGTGPLPMESSTPHPSETTRDVPGPSGSVPKFNAKSFMDKYKEMFLRCVHTPSIATRLKVDHVIPEVLYHEIDRGKITASEASEKLFLHLRSHAVPDTIHHLCDVMTGQEDYPLMKKLGEDMKKDIELPPSSTGPLPIESFTPHPSETTRDDVPGPSGPPSSPPATQGEPTPTVSTMDERSQKIEEIVDMYRSESTKVSLPEIPELEDDFDDIMGRLNAELSSADPKVICELQGMLGVKYRRYIHGVKPVEPPSIPNTPDGLYHFIAKKSTTYEILLIHHTVEKLNCEDLKRTLQNYESKLADHLRLTLESYKKRKVILPIRKHHTHLAIVLSKEQVLLSLVLHIKEYLMKCLQLEEAVFEGFGEGCTVLFFSILQVDAVLLGPKVISHSAELKRMFDMTHLVVFGYFACDLERATIELPEKQECKLKELEASLEEAKQLKDQSVSTMMKERVKLMEAQKDAEMFKKSTVELGKRNNLLEEKLRQSLVEKKEMDSLLSSLQTKQKELEGDESLLEREKLEAALKEEVATLKATLEEKDEELETTKEKLSDTESRLEGAVKELETTRQKLSDAENRLEGSVKVSKEDEDPKLCGPMKSVQISDKESKMKLFEEEKLKLSHLYWRKELDVLKSMWYPTAVYLNGKIFVAERLSGYRQFLCVFYVVSGTWFKLPFHDSCEMTGFTLATSNSKVHTLGGTWRKDGKEEKYSNKVYSLDDDLKWCNTLPPLNIGRKGATSTSFDSFILVAGGVGWNGMLSSVEVFNSSQSSSTWWEICDLPVKSWLMQCTVTHDELFIGCGGDSGYLVDTANTVYTAKLSAVKESLNVDKDSESRVSPESFWQSLSTPLMWSGLVSVNNCLLTVGGDDGLNPHSSVHLYDCYKKTWSKVSDIRKSRRSPTVVVSTFENKQELFVLGGLGASTSVESCGLL